MRILSYLVFETRLGLCGLVAGPGGLVKILLPERTPARSYQGLLAYFPEDALMKDETLEPAASQVRAFLEGKSRDLELDLDPSGVSLFDRRVHEATSRIPYGETRSYAWVAREIRSPRACQAVGQALGRNPFPLAVPCHRVIRSDGHLGGFGAGLSMKASLLLLERGHA